MPRHVVLSAAEAISDSLDAIRTNMLQLIAIGPYTRVERHTDDRIGGYRRSPTLRPCSFGPRRSLAAPLGVWPLPRPFPDSREPEGR
jgi:hypothetical protein